MPAIYTGGPGTSAGEVQPPEGLEVFRLVLEGLKSREIAERLRISIRTVDKHKEHLVSKLGVRNALGLVQAGLRMGLVRIPLTSS
jgi:DNA-binding NarL/FixJ family response regulator